MSELSEAIEARTRLYEHEAGRRLYHRWCGDPDAVTDRARYYDLMNRADSAAWARLAMEIEAEAEAKVRVAGCPDEGRVDPIVRAGFERALELADGSSLGYLVIRGAADAASGVPVNAGTVEQAMLEVLLRSVPLSDRERFLRDTPAKPYLEAALDAVVGENT
jgi:hypothetical protein